jgi:signal transduction histidine kinase
VDLGQERSRSASLQAQAEELERLNQVKSQFLSNVTHELKTPLTSIMAFTDILSRNKAGNLNDKQVNQVEAVRRNAAQLQSLINDLVDVSRIESGRISLIEREFDLAELLREIGSNMRPHFDAKRQTLTFDLPEEPVIAIADRDRIAQVIMNLLSNASKFSDSGAQVTVSASCDSTWCSFSVADNGIGISEHDQTHLFAAFYRADNSVTREHGGVGLGLSIVKSIVDLHGGKITLRSEQGKGSTFTVGIPRRLELRNAS